MQRIVTTALVVLLTATLGLALSDAFSGARANTWSTIMALSTAVAASAQAIFAAWTIKNAKAAQETVVAANATLEHQQTTSRQQLRAYLGTERAELTRCEANSPLTLTIKFVNFGATPVVGGIIRQAILFDYDEQTESAERLAVHYTGRIGSIAPSDHTKLFFNTDAPMTTEQFSDLLDGAIRIRCAFEISYTDVFGEIRTTGGQIRVTSESGSLAVWSDGPDFMT